MSQKHFSVAIAGSTAHTVMQAEAILVDPRFTIPFVLTPAPKPVGRKQIRTKNPLHLWAINHQIPVILIEKKIDHDIQHEVLQAVSKLSDKILHFLLVVDFGYLIPSWLLDLATLAPLNIHPSELPKYRGSSPGQFSLLYAEQTSAVTLMKMNNKLDEGDLIYQIKFNVLSNWNTQDYYSYAFHKISEELPNLIGRFADGLLAPTPQPTASPTPIARRLYREDGFIDPNLLGALIKREPVPQEHLTSTLLKETYKATHNWHLTVHNAMRGLSPWPGIWTVVNTQTGQKRLKILKTKLTNHQLEIIEVQQEGEKPSLLLQTHLKTLIERTQDTASKSQST